MKNMNIVYLSNKKLTEQNKKTEYDKNNIENGLWLPEEHRIYVDEKRHMNKYSSIGLAYKSAQLLLRI